MGMNTRVLPGALFLSGLVLLLASCPVAPPVAPVLGGAEVLSRELSETQDDSGNPIWDLKGK